MSEARVCIRAGGLVLEGLVGEGGANGAVVVTHPHPLYGGNMYNRVVAAIVEGYRREGYSTLRFNFRGVGQSGGGYSEGIGEQEDVETALKYFRERVKCSIDLAGYSFGAWVNAIATKKTAGLRRLILISPPVNFMDFSRIEFNPKIELVIAASKDDIAPPEIIKKMLRKWNPEAKLRIIRDADHFYQGKTSEITEILQKFLRAGDTALHMPKSAAGPETDE